jgi:hypothetical protein
VEVFPQGRGRVLAPRSLSGKENVTCPGPVRQIAVNCATAQLNGRFPGRSQLCATFRDQTVITTSASLCTLGEHCHRAHGRSPMRRTGRWIARRHHACGTSR